MKNCIIFLLLPNGIIQLRRGRVEASVKGSGFGVGIFFVRCDSYLAV